MPMIRALPSFALALLAAGCMTTAPQGDGWAAIGEPTHSGRLTVTPIAIVEDSRCPQDAQCVWAGRLVVRTRIAHEGSRIEDIEMGEEIRIADGLLELDRAEPAAAGGVEIAPGEYRFHYRFAPLVMEAN